MKLGIMQPYFFPYLGYWQLINAVDKFVIHDDVNYIKSGWINRNYILINGESKYIHLSLKKASQNKHINEIEISQDDSYNKNLLKIIKTSYRKAPYFEEVFPILEDIISQKECNLSKYLVSSISKISKYLNINTEILVSSNIKKNNHLKGQERVIEICKKLNANQYINAIGGQNLYSGSDFASQDIELKFLISNKVNYQQFDQNKFVPNLSIIDVIMFNSPETVKSMLNKYELVSNMEMEVKSNSFGSY